MGTVALSKALRAMPISPVQDFQSEVVNTGVLAFGLLQFTGSASYATGGDTVDLSKYFNSIPEFVAVMPTTSNFQGVYVPGTTVANGKIKFFTTANTEVTNATNLSAETITLLVFGSSLVHP